MLQRIFNTALALLFWLAAGVFAISLLLAGMVAFAIGAAWMLLTGRKPVAAFRRYRDFAGRTGWPQRSPYGRAPGRVPSPGNSGVNAGQVVDAEVKEIREGESIQPRRSPE